MAMCKLKAKRSKALGYSYSNDIIECEESYKYIMDVPGFKAEEIKVRLEDEKNLYIRGKLKMKQEIMNGESAEVVYLKKQRKFHTFTKSYRLPANTNTDCISAVIENGVLTVTVVKSIPSEPMKPTKIIQVLKSST